MPGRDATGRETSSQRSAWEVTSAQAVAGHAGPGRARAASAVHEAVGSGTTLSGVLTANRGENKERLSAESVPQWVAGRSGLRTPPTGCRRPPTLLPQ